MEIKEFVSKFKNHPVLFVGSGLSHRYLEESYTWNALLAKIAHSIYGNTERYQDIRGKCESNGVFNYPRIASTLEVEFNQMLESDRNGKFGYINDLLV